MILLKCNNYNQRSEIIINSSTCIIIFKEPMQSFKGLLPRQVLTDDAFLPIHKKAEDHRKAAQVCLDFFHQINKFFQGFSAAVEKCVKQCDIDNVKAPYYSLIGFVCTKIVFENQQLTENTKGSSKELTKVCNVILEDYAKFINNFQTDLRKYQQNEAIMQQICKKYFRSHKNMITSIEAYKNTLTDVTLIYNTEEKIKRFQACQANYKIVLTDFSSVNEKCESLSQRKLNIVSQYQGLKKQYTKVIKLIGSKMIGEAKNFFSYYCSTNKNIVAFLAEQKYNLEKEKLRPFFADIEDMSNRQMFKQEINDRKGKSTIPLIFDCYDLIKDQFLESYNFEMVNYLKRVEENIEKRKLDNKKVLDLFLQYVKVIEKVHIVGVKQIMQKFQKLKIRLKETFGARLVSFMKSINSILQLLSGSNQKLVKDINPELLLLQSYINEESKMLVLFYDQMKGKIQKFIGKKELKKLKEDQFTQQNSVKNVSSFRKDIAQKAEFFKHLIKGFEDKMSKTCEKICNGYTNLISTLGQTINKFYSYCCQYQQLYFGPEQFKKNFQMYEKDCQALLQKNIVFFDELSFNVLKEDNQKILFDGQFGKIQEFKKLKKPVIQDNGPKQNQKPEKLEIKDVKEIKEVKQDLGPQSPKSLKQNQLEQKEKIEISAAKSEKQLNNQEITVRKNSLPKDLSSIEQKQIKNYQFLISKVQMKENEQYIKSYSCALSEKIVLQGRIYITNNRICFYSGFNSSTIFFGGTFIEFPKEDILKIQKRMNAFFIDNSISFTTVKGELTFTSFFSRNEAYDLICRTFDISLNDHMYETIETEINQEMEDPNIQIKQEDDLQDGQIPSRQAKINSLLTTFTYNEAVKIDISKQNLNAFQIFKTCYSSNQISINRRKYPNFLTYIKQLISHKDLEVDQWNPSLEEILNKRNIKSTAPLKSTRRIRVTVPVANSGVPFMPKTAKSEQIQTLYFYSKNKWIIEAQINTTGAPYTDTFKVQLRTTASSNNEGKCLISIGYFVNFVKSTMMKSVIESKSQQETVKASKTWVDQIKKYFNNLLKAEALSQKQVKQPGVQQIREELEAKTGELQNIKRQKQQLELSVKDLKANEEKLKKIIFGLGILCFMLLVLSIS